MAKKVSVNVIGERVFLQLIEDKAEVQSDGGVLTGSIQVDKRYTGRVLGVGDALVDKALPFGIGSIVVYDKFGGQKISFDYTNQYLIVRLDEILGVISYTETEDKSKIIQTESELFTG